MAQNSTQGAKNGYRHQYAVFAGMVVLFLVLPYVIYPVFLMQALCFALFACAFNLLIGYTGLINDAKGQFQANTAAPNFARALPPAVLACFREQPDASALLRRSFNALVTRLEAELKSAEYRGPVGVDAFVYREPDGRCRLKPVVEINPRYTMGRLTLELMKRVAPGAQGRFRLLNAATLKAAGHADFVSYARHLGEQSPLRLEGDPVPKIRSGAICLNDPARAQAVLAVFHVGDDVRSL